MHVEERPRLATRIREAVGVDVDRCYQCGKCTAGCPMANYMDLVPSRVMRLVQIGDEATLDKLLTGTAIWSCAACLTCTQRCPQELDPAAVIDALREMSYYRHKVSPSQQKVVAFHRAFLDTVRADGRMSEIPLTRRYKLASLDLLSDVILAPLMVARGKLPFRSHRIKGWRELRRIFEACEYGKGGQTGAEGRNGTGEKDGTP